MTRVNRTYRKENLAVYTDTNIVLITPINRCLVHAEDTRGTAKTCWSASPFCWTTFFWSAGHRTSVRRMFRALFLIFISAACLVTVNGEENVHQPEDGGRWWYAPSRKAHRRPSLERIKFKQEQLEDAWRLPGDLSPVTYYVRLLPFIEVGNWTTAGFVEVLFNCVRDTHNITVNSAELVIDQNSIKVRK